MEVVSCGCYLTGHHLFTEIDRLEWESVIRQVQLFLNRDHIFLDTGDNCDAMNLGVFLNLEFFLAGCINSFLTWGFG